MIPTEPIANPASPPKTGLLATLRALLHAQGSIAPSRALIAAPLITLCALFASLAAGALFVAPVAQAEPPGLVSDGQFASVATHPVGVAVDNSGLASAGDVYVAGLFDPEESPIDKFDASGKKLSPPSPFGANYVGGVAVNPTNGDLYVFNIFGSITTYDPNTGEPVGSPFPVPVAGEIFQRTVQIATDSAGDVYVPERFQETSSGLAPSDEVHEYSPSGALLKTFTASGTLKGPTGVAVDSSGEVWVADHGNNRIEELSPAGAPIGEIKSEGVTSVALAGHGHVLALVSNGADNCGQIEPPCAHLVEYSLSGALLADDGAGAFESGEGLPRLPLVVAASETTGRAYVVDSVTNKVWVFAPPTAPALDTELSAEVTTSEAKLGALVNPGGIETTYRFEYGTTTAYGHSTPFPEGSVGEGFSARTVWAAASGLAPGTTYHYRVVVASELGTTVGRDQTFTTKTAAEASCPNEQLRTGFSANLPDCRAYELVTPPNSASAQPDSENGGQPLTGGGASRNQAARNGEAMSFGTAEPMPGSDSAGYYYVAKRGAGGWSSEDVVPLQSYTGDRCTTPVVTGAVDAYSANLTMGILAVGGGQNIGETPPGNTPYNCGAEFIEVVQGEPLGVENLLLRDNASGSYRLINLPPMGVTPNNAHFQLASADLSHVVFAETAKLTENALPGVENLYEWDEGVVRLLTVLPDGTPVVGGLAANGNVIPGVISEEGSHIFFVSGAKLYVRVNGEVTVQLDEPRGGSGPGGGGQFKAASADGSVAFFTDDAAAGLTSDTVSGSGVNLYRYTAGALTNLTPAEHAPAEHAEVTEVLGASKDGSYVYFVAHGVLSGSQKNQKGEAAQPGQPNMYLWHNGATTFITGQPTHLGHPVVSATGAFFAFETQGSPTGYDNRNVSEIYLYSAASNQLACASCNPSGEPPVAGGAELSGANGLAGQGAPHHLSASGRLFFQTEESLVPRDTNGQMDVYEYEQGELHLISSGTSTIRSWLLDADESGENVFFLSRQQLVPQDSNGGEANVIYDARVDGGFPALASPPACTTADACRTPVSPQPSLYGAPSSQTFSGVGNLTPGEAKPKAKPKSKPVKCKRRFVRRKGKCVKKFTKKARKSTHANRTGK